MARQFLFDDEYSCSHSHSFHYFRVYMDIRVPITSVHTRFPMSISSKNPSVWFMWRLWTYFYGVRTGMGLQKVEVRTDLAQDSSLFLNFQFSSDKRHYPTWKVSRRLSVHSEPPHFFSDYSHSLILCDHPLFSLPSSLLSNLFSVSSSDSHCPSSSFHFLTWIGNWVRA